MVVNKVLKNISRKGLSPLLAIIIGLVVTIVAGILLAQLYFSYAATVSARPAANIEYVDLIETPGGADDVLVLNVKNMGSTPITSVDIDVDGDGNADNICLPDQGIAPGQVLGLTCTVNDKDVTLGGAYQAVVIVGFDTNGDTTADAAQAYAISARARSA